jgi:hypothetical protein
MGATTRLWDAVYQGGLDQGWAEEKVDDAEEEVMGWGGQQWWVYHPQ